MRIAIIGGGVASLEAAIAARTTSDTAEITLFAGEKIRPYRRPMLSGLLKGSPVDEKIFFLKPEDFFAANRIGLRLDSPVEAIKGNCLELTGGELFPFDRLIIATGSKARVPRVPTAPGALVFTLREYLDLVKLNAFLPDLRQVAVIGGSVLGLEIADSLLARNLQVTVLERSARLFPGRLAPEASAELRTRLAGHERLTIHCGVDVAGISRAGVLDNSGMIYPADAVIFAAGAEPRTILAAEAGLEVGKGIKVDAAMRTSQENIFAAGDAAEFNGTVFGLFTDAMATGKIAGINAAGGSAVFNAKPAPLRLFALGEKLTMP